MPAASATAKTRYGISGWGTRRAGSFNGKTPANVPSVANPFYRPLATAVSETRRLSPAETTDTRRLSPASSDT